MIIAFCGQKNNGKDTAGEILKELGNSEGIRFKRAAFADAMKRLAANSLGVYDNEIEWFNSVKDEIIHIPPPEYTVSGRQFLINFGQTMKSQFGDDFWAHLAFSNIAPWPDIVVTDLRFEAEAEYLRNIGAWIIHIYNDPNQEDGTLAGEQKLPEHYIDYYLANTGTKKDLQKSLRAILTDIIRLEETYDSDYDDEEKRRSDTDEWL